jgi:hypothetical protein
MAESLRRGVIVLGQGRSGTSVIAGVLRHLGVYMGKPLSHHWEDGKLMRIHDAMIGDWKNPRLDAEPYLSRYNKFFASRQRHDLWGVKDPRLCFTFPVLVSLLLPDATSDIKIIVTSRPLKNIAASLARYPGIRSYSEARCIAECYASALSQSVAKIPAEWPSMTVRYDDLIDNPCKHVGRIASFIGVQVTDRAISLVKPALRHHK